MPIYAKTIEITTPTTLRSNSFYAGDTFTIGTIERGAKAQILQYDTDKLFGVGMMVKVLSGMNAGRVGWIYYHQDPQKRTLNLLNDKGGIYTPERDKFLQYFINQSESVNTTSLVLIDMPVSTSDQLSIDGIWSNIYSGKYRISEEDSNGTFLTIKRKVYDERGGTRIESFQIPYDEKRILKVQDHLLRPHLINDDCNDHARTDNQMQDTRNEYSGTKGCEELGRALDNSSYNSLANCLNILKRKILKNAGSKDNINRDIVYKNLYSLPIQEQEFLGHTLTAFGEAGILTPPLEEMLGVMKVLDNRKKYARKKGFSKANILDAALQHKQFSMWNKNDPNWKRAIRASQDNPHTQNSIKAFIKFGQSKFSNMNKVYHYHTNYVQADWSKNKRPIKAIVNGAVLHGRKGTKHKFFKNIPWSFSYNKSKPLD